MPRCAPFCRMICETWSLFAGVWLSIGYRFLRSITSTEWNDRVSSVKVKNLVLRPGSEKTFSKWIEHGRPR